MPSTSSSWHFGFFVLHPPNQGELCFVKDDLSCPLDLFVYPLFSHCFCCSVRSLSKNKVPNDRVSVEKMSPYQHPPGTWCRTCEVGSRYMSPDILEYTPPETTIPWTMKVEPCQQDDSHLPPSGGVQGPC